MKLSGKRSVLFPVVCCWGLPPGPAATLPCLALMPCNCVSLPLIKLTGNPMAVTYVLDPKGDRIRWWHFLHRALNMPSKSPIARKTVSTAGEALTSASGSASGAVGFLSERPQRTSCPWMGSRRASENSCSLENRVLWHRCWKSRAQ